MAISTILVGRCYRQAPDILTPLRTSADIRKEKPERGEGAKVRHRVRRATHRQTGGGVEHPYRNFQNAATPFDLAASSNRAVPFLQNVVNANPLASPGMPWIRNRPLVGYLGNVGVLSFGCTIVSGSIPLSGISTPNT